MTRNYNLAMSREEFDSLFLETLKGIDKWKLDAVATHMRDAARELAGDNRATRRQKRKDRQPINERKEASRARQELRQDVYEAYMKSQQWFDIRKRVMARDDQRCLCCGKKATQVHHRSYHQSVMDGKDDSKLASVCGSCHSALHFNKDGKRVRKADVEQMFLAMASRSKPRD